MYIILSYVDLLLFLCYIHYIILIIIHVLYYFFLYHTSSTYIITGLVRVVGLKNNNRKAEKIMDTPAINYSTKYIIYIL